MNDNNPPQAGQNHESAAAPQPTPDKAATEKTSSPNLEKMTDSAQTSNTSAGPAQSAPIKGNGDTPKADITAPADAHPASESGTIPQGMQTAAEPEAKTAETKALESRAEPDGWHSLFNGCAKIGPIILLLALACMVWPDIWNAAKALYCPGESRYVSAFLHAIDQNAWMTPMGLDNGVWSAPQWPIFYWFAGLIGLVPYINDSGLLMASVVIASFSLALLGAWSLSMAAGFGSRAALAAGIILLCAPIFAPLSHFFGPAPLSTALMLFSLTCFCRGWRANHAWIWLPLAFILDALAGLCGGELYFAVPLLASFCFLIWQGRMRRAQAMDALCGFVLMLLILGLWLGPIMLGKHDANYLTHLFNFSFKLDWPPAGLWWAGLVLGVVGLMPWLIMLITVSWVRVLGHAGRTLSASRHDNGSALIWIAAVLTCCIGIFIPVPPVTGIPLACLLAILLGKAFTNLSPIGSRSFFFFTAILLCLVGLVVFAAYFSFTRAWLLALLPFTVPASITDAISGLTSLPVLGGIILVGGLLAFYFAKDYHGGGGIIYALALSIILSQPFLLMFVPEVASIPESRLVTLADIQKQVNTAIGVPVQTPASQEPTPAATQQQEQSNDENVSQETTPAETPAVVPPSETDVTEPQPVENSAQQENTADVAVPENQEPAAAGNAESVENQESAVSGNSGDVENAPAREEAPANPDATAPTENPDSKAEAGEPAEKNHEEIIILEKKAEEIPRQPEQTENSPQ